MATLKTTAELDIAQKHTDEMSQTLLSADDKQEIIYLITDAVQQLGAATKVASKCDVSSATISQMISNQYITKDDKMWRKVANALGWRSKSWVVSPDVTNTTIVTQILTDAQRESMFVAISENAGCGKTAGTLLYLDNDRSGNVFHLKCRYWSKLEFLVRLRTTLGLPVAKGVNTANDMLDQVIHFFKMRKGKPLLILDQANSLKPQSLELLIHIFNELEDRLAVVMTGTRNLRKMIEGGAQYNRAAYDELASRFGRNFISLPGYNFKDCRRMCAANGITDQAVQQIIWNDSYPVTKEIAQANAGGGSGKGHVTVVEDGRRIKRAIMKQLMLRKLNSSMN